MNQESNKQRTSIFILTFSIFFVFLVLTAYFAWFLAIGSERYLKSAYNPVNAKKAEDVERGVIYAGDGSVLAKNTIDANGKEIRSYPYGSVFSQIVGYNGAGTGGLEKTENETLMKSHDNIISKSKKNLNDKKLPGDNINTTLSPSLQQAVYNAFGSNIKGALIAMDPETGAVLCSVSKPDYDPNTISEDWNSLVNSSDNGSPLFNRAVQGRYTPGSTFKIVTLLEYLREGGSENDRFNCNGAYTYKGYTVHCAGGERHGSENTLAAFYNSCNVAFSQIGLKLDIDSYRKTASSLLFNKKLPGDIDGTVKSSFSLKNGDSSSLVMATAFGQGNTHISPYHMMLISASIYNEGTLMEPYMVSSVVSADGKTVSSHSVKRYTDLMTRDEAAELQNFMRNVVTHGTGRRLNTGAYMAYGKTGTAQIGDGNVTNSLFTGFATDPNGEKPIAFAAVAEGSEHYSPAAISLVKSLLEEWYKK
jgi:peptidoglycan glycosyltransferase